MLLKLVLAFDSETDSNEAINPNKRLKDNEHLAGEYSIADIILYPWTVTLEDIAEIDIADYPHLNRWAININKHLKAIESTQTTPERRDWCYKNNKFAFCSA